MFKMEPISLRCPDGRNTPQSIKTLSYRNLNKSNSDSPYPSGKRLDQIGKYSDTTQPFVKRAVRSKIAHERKRVPIWYLCIFLPFLISALIFLLSIKAKIDKSMNEGARLILNAKMEPTRAITHGQNTPRSIKGEGIKSIQPDYVGEKIIYDVKLGKLHLGKTQFNNLANVQLDGRLLNVMTVEIKLRQFTDMEKIYSDPETLLPIRVERDILNWLTQERITEDYDQDNFTVTIIKNKGAKQKKLVIKKDSHIHNVVLLPYYVRRMPSLDVGKIIIADLPTRRLEIKLVSIEDIKLPAGTFKAFHFKSTPKQIEIWISTDERKIPLKIQGTGLFGYSMVMREYSFTPNI